MTKEFMNSTCITTQDTVCLSCSTSCPTGYYQDLACTATADRRCRACATKCPAGYHLSSIRVCSGTTMSDEVLASCIACKMPSDCGAGFYLSGTCSGTEVVSNVCLQCTSGNCGPSQYRGYCGGYNDTMCEEYRACATGQYLAGESRDNDGVCASCSTCGTGVVRPCSRYEDTVCGGAPCSPAVSCSRRATGTLSFFCDYTRGANYASCGACPHGYGSDGQLCQECPRGSTCNKAGAVACKGQCRAGVLASCESEWGLGYVSCDQQCPAEGVASQVQWRGPYAEFEGTSCAGVYFRCSAGFYKQFGTGGTVGCEPCADTGQGGLARWVTEGLSVGDATSCLWECKRELAVAGCVVRAGREQGGGWNQAGAWASSTGGGSCRVGFTSEAQTAMAIGECLACPTLDPLTQRLKTVTTQCDWECIEFGATKMGGKCVKPRGDCLTEGVSELAGVCLPTSYPWNRPGYTKTGWGVPVASQYTGKPWDATEPVTFASIPYGVSNRHTLLVTSGGTVRTIPGAMCSGVLGGWGGKTYVYGALCNQSFLVYLDLSVSNSKMGLLIGNSTRGWQDGFRTQALFQDELYVASGGDNSRLFVLDKWNCLLREVVIWDTPGGYRNRVHTVWGIMSDLGGGAYEPRCYGLGGLAWPRKFWDLTGDWLAFADEDGLWQFNKVTRELARMVLESDGQFEADGLEWVEATADTTLSLWFTGGVKWTVAAGQAKCPVDWTSLVGGGCIVECRRSNGMFVDMETGACRPCTTLSCGVGQQAVACTAESDGYCQACPAVLGLAYSQAGNCEATTKRPVPPCTPGWYAVASGLYCELCPEYTATRLAGAGRIEQCKCLDGLSRRGGACVGERLYDFEENRLCAGGSSCALPGNAGLVQAETCGWACNTGYYRDTLAGFQDQCRPCKSTGTRTRGDDDQPWSCE